MPEPLPRSENNYFDVKTKKSTFEGPRHKINNLEYITHTMRYTIKDIIGFPSYIKKKGTEIFRSTMKKITRSDKLNLVTAR